MIAAQQMEFIKKIVCAPPSCPAQQMLTACCDNICSMYIIKNLRLLFANIPKVTNELDPRSPPQTILDTTCRLPH